MLCMPCMPCTMWVHYYAGIVVSVEVVTLTKKISKKKKSYLFDSVLISHMHDFSLVDFT